MFAKWFPNTTFHLFTDSSDTLGFGAYLQGHWFQGRWSPSHLFSSIQWKELYPSVVAVATWGPQWHTKQVLFLCDNKSVVAEGTSNSPDMHDGASLQSLSVHSVEQF